MKRITNENEAAGNLSVKNNWFSPPHITTFDWISLVIDFLVSAKIVFMWFHFALEVTVHHMCVNRQIERAVTNDNAIVKLHHGSR